MNPIQIKKEIENKEILLLDVRENYEWEEGHIDGAKHIPLGDIDEETIKKIPKDLPVYIYCLSGGRAGVAESILRKFGFSKAKNIGGIIEWQENGGKLVK